jgi:mono/diheme cytochrome c family protein
MRDKTRPLVIIWTWCGALAIALATCLAWPSAAGSGVKKRAAPRWSTLSVDLPISDKPFPAGNGADIATGQCLICHSAGMVLHQPPLTRGEWISEINKMRNAFGAPMPASQVEALADYLYATNGRREDTMP